VRLRSNSCVFGGREMPMQRDELMKADLLSEIVLLSSGILILMALLMVLVVAVAGGSVA
jgi:hypothetical protein